MKTVILDGARTAFGKFGGGLAALQASDLGGIAIKAALEKSNITADQIGEVIVGTVLQAGHWHILHAS